MVINYFVLSFLCVVDSVHCLCCGGYVNEIVQRQVQVWVVLPLLNEVKAFKIGVRSVLGSEDQGHVCIDLMFPVILNGESYWDKYR